MSLIGENPAPIQAGGGKSEHIKDGTDASFMADVIEASKTQPVIVDFWATWCGPCRQLTPAIEKVVTAAKGAVKLVKIDVDKNPGFAGQLRVQSIPTVFAFVDGQPVDGFQGALPESQIQAFVDRLSGPPAAGAVDELLAMAKESLEVDDLGGAAQAFAQVLQLEPENIKALGGLARVYLAGGDLEPENIKALGGLARVYLAGGDLERAGEIAAMAPETAKDPDLESVRAALKLAQAAPSETAAFEQRLAADADDHEARFELAKALAGAGRLDAACDHLLTIIARDRAWNDEAARKQLLTVFEAAGPTSEVAKQGRKRLSSILFS